MKKILLIVSVILTAATLCYAKSDGQDRKKKAADDDKRKPFVGVTAVNIDNSCRPQKCQEQCKNACEGAAGEECFWAFDVLQECVKAHPSQQSSEDAASMHAQMIGCLQQHQQEYEKYRCTFVSGDLDHRLFTSADPAGECRKVFEEYQGCLKKEKLKDGGDAAQAAIDVLKGCQDRYREALAAHQCALATDKNVRRLYGRDDAQAITCFMECK